MRLQKNGTTICPLYQKKKLNFKKISHLGGMGFHTFQMTYFLVKQH